MTTNPAARTTAARTTAARTTAGRTDESLPGTLRDIATMFTDVSNELERFGERVLDRLADIYAAQRDESRGSARSGGLPPPTDSGDAVPVPLPGEPVDTSFADPDHTPAARAAGVSPCQNPSQEQVPSQGQNPSQGQAPSQQAPRNSRQSRHSVSSETT